MYPYALLHSYIFSIDAQLHVCLSGMHSTVDPYTPTRDTVSLAVWAHMGKCVWGGGEDDIGIPIYM